MVTASSSWRPRKGPLARNAARPRSLRQQLAAVAPTVPSNSYSSTEPASSLRRRASAALAPIRRGDVTQHLLHVYTAPLPGRAAALLACHCCTHTSYLSSDRAVTCSAMFFPDDLEHLGVDGQEPSELDEQVLAG